MLQCKDVNPSIIGVLQSWYSNSSIKVQWAGCLSQQVDLKSGVRQGGVLSPLLFACYVDVVLEKLESSGLGCFVDKQCLNSFMYADDLILLSISVMDMQKMVTLCSEAFAQLNLTINTDKSHCMRIGPTFKNACSNITINNQPLMWENKTKFLGITILSALCVTGMMPEVVSTKLLTQF